MHAVSVTIQLHKISEVPLVSGPMTHGDAVVVLRAVRLFPAAESYSSTVGDAGARLIFMANNKAV